MIVIPLAWVLPLVRIGGMVVLFILMPGLILFGLQDYELYQELLQKGQLAEAEVINASDWCVRNRLTQEQYGRCQHLVSYQYRVDEKTFLVEGEHVASEKLYDDYMKAGQAQIYYLPDKPSKSRLVDDYTYEAKLGVSILNFAALWGCLVGFGWLPPSKPSLIIQDFFYYLRYMVIYLPTVVMLVGLRISQIESQSIPLCAPIILILSLVVLPIVLFAEKYFLKKERLEQKQATYKSRILLYPFYLMLYTVGGLIAATTLNGNIVTAYLIIGCILAAIIHFSPLLIQEYQRRELKRKLTRRI